MPANIQELVALDEQYKIISIHIILTEIQVPATVKYEQIPTTYTFEQFIIY